MIICLDVGNTHIYAGVFHNDQLLVQFRHATTLGITSDQLGIFFKTALRENDIPVNQISHIVVCSVVPHIEYSLRSACLKYFKVEPFFIHTGIKTGLIIQYQTPTELGADRIVNAIAATQQFPQQNLIVVDMGTATTICAINAKREYLGGPILTGMRLAMDALQAKAAKLFAVEIIKPEIALAKTTKEGLQAGLYYGQLGAIREIIHRITHEAFAGQMPLVVGTGGFAHLFENEELFAFILPDLILQGLLAAWKMNQ